jgi:y4mF family transcriptional regulator
MEPTTITDPATLGALVRERRHQLGLTQTEVADVARTTLRFVSELESGKRTAQLDGVLRVLRALGIDLVARTR